MLCEYLFDLLRHTIDYLWQSKVVKLGQVGATALETGLIHLYQVSYSTKFLSLNETCISNARTPLTSSGTPLITYGSLKS